MVSKATGGAVTVTPPPYPHELMYLYVIWAELNSARGSSGFGPNPISWPDIAAWSKITDWPLEPWEARAIRAVETAYLISKSE